MEGTLLKPVQTPEDQARLANLANEIWHGYWPAIIGQAQTDYMVERFQSLAAIQRDMKENNYEYWFVLDEQGEPCGFTGGHNEPDTNRYFISKIYLQENARGKGLSSAVIRFYDELCQKRGLQAMYLTVNKQNELGIRAYVGNGFQIIESVRTPIGEGFIMDDYIMERAAGLSMSDTRSAMPAASSPTHSNS